MKRYHIWISGVVQGVGFRSFIRRTATKLGINGWVRNLLDGRVEVIAEGEEDKLEELVNRMRVGPRLATVEDIKIEKEDYNGQFERFEVRF